VKVFHNPTTDEKYRRLGFAEDGLFLKLRVGNVTVCAGEHLFKGVFLIFESFSTRTLCQYEVTLPESCGVEQIAKLIYLNVAQNFGESKDVWKIYFENLGVSSVQ
jgi:hypothetical protein